MFLCCFWACVGQPDNHISWAKPMPFSSINSTNPRTNAWKFHEKILRIGGAGKWGFFEAAILNFLSRPFWIFFASYQWKTQPINMRYHFFPHYGWFLQNFEKDFIPTLLHTTVDCKIDYRTRAIISRSWLQASLEYKPYIRTEISEKTSLKKRNGLWKWGRKYTSRG